MFPTRKKHPERNFNFSFLNQIWNRKISFFQLYCTRLMFRINTFHLRFPFVTQNKLFQNLRHLRVLNNLQRTWTFGTTNTDNFNCSFVKNVNLTKLQKSAQGNLCLMFFLLRLNAMSCVTTSADSNRSSWSPSYK